MASAITAIRRRESVKRDLTTSLIGSFKKLISEGVLTPGSKLPAERDLARRFRVSRSSLRQALKVLDIMGVLSQRVGDGTYLNSSARAILSEPLDFLVLMDGISHHELFEARFIVEPELAARAAERATVEDLAVLRRELKNLDRSGLSRRKLIEADIAFHEAVFLASGNRVCQSMFSVIHRALLASMVRGSGDFRHTFVFHSRIYRAIHNRNAEDARQRMIEHLDQARKVLFNDECSRDIRNVASFIQPIRRTKRIELKVRRTKK